MHATQCADAFRSWLTSEEGLDKAVAQKYAAAFKTLLRNRGSVNAVSMTVKKTINTSRQKIEAFVRLPQFKRAGQSDDSKVIATTSRKPLKSMKIARPRRAIKATVSSPAKIPMGRALASAIQRKLRKKSRSVVSETAADKTTKEVPSPPPPSPKAFSHKRMLAWSHDGGKFAKALARAVAKQQLVQSPATPPQATGELSIPHSPDKDHSSAVKTPAKPAVLEVLSADANQLSSPQLPVASNVDEAYSSPPKLDADITTPAKPSVGTECAGASTGKVKPRQKKKLRPVVEQGETGSDEKKNKQEAVPVAEAPKAARVAAPVPGPNTKALPEEAVSASDTLESTPKPRARTSRMKRKLQTPEPSPDKMLEIGAEAMQKPKRVKRRQALAEENLESKDAPSGKVSSLWTEAQEKEWEGLLLGQVGAPVAYRDFNKCTIAEVLGDGNVMIDVPELGTYKARPGQWRMLVSTVAPLDAVAKPLSAFAEAGA